MIDHHLRYVTFGTYHHGARPGYLNEKLLSDIFREERYSLSIVYEV